jgi:serine/threonine protein kinase
MQIAEALREMHRAGVIHGDVKPLNIMRVGDRMKLIDLDASVRLAEEYSGAKYSSGLSRSLLKQFPLNNQCGILYTLLIV